AGRRWSLVGLRSVRVGGIVVPVVGAVVAVLAVLPSGLVALVPRLGCHFPVVCVEPLSAYLSRHLGAHGGLGDLRYVGGVVGPRHALGRVDASALDAWTLGVGGVDGPCTVVVADALRQPTHHAPARITASQHMPATLRVIARHAAAIQYRSLRWARCSRSMCSRSSSFISRSSRGHSSGSCIPPSP